MVVLGLHNVDAMWMQLCDIVYFLSKSHKLLRIDMLSKETEDTGIFVLALSL